MDPSKDDKENVLVMMDAFSNFTVAIATSNQWAKTVAKSLVDRWFYTYGIPYRIHRDQGKSFDNKCYIIFFLYIFHWYKGNI